MSFGSNLESFAEQAILDIERRRRATILQLFTAVIKDTPVSDEKTSPKAAHGLLRSNWQTTIGMPAAEPLPKRNESNAIAEIRHRVLSLVDDSDVWFVNRLPYACRVEYEGWSHTKAPEGMLRRNVVRFVDIWKGTEATIL
jgi:hypothetical protein